MVGTPTPDARDPGRTRRDVRLASQMCGRSDSKTAVARQARCCTYGFSKTCLRCCGRRNKAELFQHRQPVEHQIERDMLAAAKAEDLDIVHFDRSARRWNVTRGAVQNAVLRPPECAFLNCDVVEDVNGFDFDARIRESSEPTAEERGTRGFSLAVHSAWRLENHVVGKNFRKAVKVMGVKGSCSLFESLACGHCHWILLRIIEFAPKGCAGGRCFARGLAPWFLSRRRILTAADVARCRAWRMRGQGDPRWF